MQQLLSSCCGCCCVVPLYIATVTDFIWMGVFGQSSLVGTLEILTMTSKDAWSTHLPKTGCLDSPGENQSRKLRARRAGERRAGERRGGERRRGEEEEQVRGGGGEGERRWRREEEEEVS